MQEHDANLIAPIFGGNPWQPYPGIWLLLVERDDGSVVVFDSAMICSYDDYRELEDGEPCIEIRLDTD